MCLYDRQSVVKRAAVIGQNVCESFRVESAAVVRSWSNPNGQTHGTRPLVPAAQRGLTVTPWPPSRGRGRAPSCSCMWLSTRLAEAPLLSLGEDAALAQSKWASPDFFFFFREASANEWRNSCWAGCAHTPPRLRPTAPSAGDCLPSFSFVSRQVTLPTSGCVAAFM